MDDITIQGLRMLQADHQVFYGKLRNYHWTVKGPRFFELHALFEQTYAESVDLARLKEDPDSPESGRMLKNVHDDLDHLINSLKATAKQAESAGDSTTFNLLDGKVDQAEGHAWMIRSALG